MRSTTVDVPPLDFRADVGAVDEDARTVDLIFSTGADVVRYDWMTGERYIERLSMKPQHVRLQRLNSGAPLLNTHSSYELRDQLGVVVDGSASVNGKTGLARVRFSKRDDVEPIYRDVLDKIVRNVSVGYRVHKFEEERGEDKKLPIRTAVDWEPYEISMVPMPADTGAQVRAKQVETNACEIVTRETPMEEQNREQSEFIAERNPLDPGAPTGQAAPRMALAEPPEPNEADRGADRERKRVQGIISACRAARLPSTFADKLIAEGGLGLEAAQSRIFDEMGRREPTAEIRNQVSVQVGEDPLVHVRSGIENALLHRLAPEKFKLEDVGRNYRGMTMMDVARAFLQARGVRTTNMSKNELAGMALGLVETRTSGMHTTSDFALLLADVANKTLRRAYEEQPQTFAPLGRRVTIPDFKPVRRLQFGDAPDLLEIEEHGEYKSGTIGEGKEQYQLATYGRKFAITRKALINDDTDAFSRVPMMFGRKSRTLESNLVWAQITSNPVMGDGEQLFSAAHGNELSPGVISINTLGDARFALRMQTSIDGEIINLSTRYLVVPPSLETLADQFVAVVTAQQPGQVNPFQGKLTVIAEPRLETASNFAWYAFASPDQVDIFEFGYLEGEEGPQVESRVGFDVDGVEIKCRLDFAAKVIDWRGIARNLGGS